MFGHKLVQTLDKLVTRRFGLKFEPARDTNKYKLVKVTYNDYRTPMEKVNRETSQKSDLLGRLESRNCDHTFAFCQ